MILCHHCFIMVSNLLEKLVRRFLKTYPKKKNFSITITSQRLTPVLNALNGDMHKFLGVIPIRIELGMIFELV